MKDRVLIVLAGVLDGMKNSLAIPTNEVNRFCKDCFLSTVFAGEEFIAYAVSPVIWPASFLVTAATRILP